LFKIRKSDVAMAGRQHPVSLLTVAMVMCAVLYAVGAYSTAYIPSPWGVGQFRWAVVIPAFFATIFGPMPAGIGAAVGTLIADSVKHGYLYPGSYLAAVPGNFIGFYLFGYIVKKKFTWGRFILASNVTLTVANLIVAFLYVFFFKVLYLSQQKYVKMSSDAQIFLSIGLTIWWFVTMLPFVLLVTPMLIRAVAAAVPSVVPEEVRIHSLKQELPKKTFSLAMLIPGLIMILMGLATTYTTLGNYINSFFGEAIFSLIQLMFYASGLILAVLGTIVYTGRMFLWPRTPLEESKK
jgi:MFS family permease